MGKRYNPENFVDRVYMDSKFAELRTELITYFDGRLRELQEMINTESEPPAEKKEDSRGCCVDGCSDRSNLCILLCRI